MGIPIKLIHDYQAVLVEKVKSATTKNLSLHNFDQTYNLRPIWKNQLGNTITLLHFKCLFETVWIKVPKGAKCCKAFPVPHGRFGAIATSPINFPIVTTSLMCWFFSNSMKLWPSLLYSICIS